MAGTDVTRTETAKERSLRVPLDHYTQSDPLVRRKLRLTLVLGAAVAVYVVWLLAAGGAGRQHASAGPVAAAHASIEHDCHACHRTFRPLRADALDWAALTQPPAARREQLDAACLRCHRAPAHHAAMKPDEVPTCAACHREHAGRHADIVRADDAACTRCHADLAAHRQTAAAPAASPLENVIAFAVAAVGASPPHPGFRSLRADPGNIRFNHWLHLQPGVALADAKQKLTLQQLEAADQPAYARFASASGLVQLDCSACHEPDRGSDGAHAGGQYMRPIAYQRHCRACHPLDVKLAGDERPAHRLPHGLAGSELAAVVEGLLWKSEQGRVVEPPPAPDESGAAPLIPGKTLGDNLAQRISRDVLARRERALAAVEVKCLQCHYRAASATAGTSGEIDVRPAQIPREWFVHARFDHAAHEATACRECHAAAYAFEKAAAPQLLPPPAGELPAGIAPARDDATVMIAGITSCVRCHAPRRGDQGGARSDCAECHAYHGREVVQGSKFKVQSSRFNVQSWKQVQGPTSNVQNPQSGDAPLLHSNLQSAIFNLQSLSLVSRAALAPQFVGSASCAATGCHGSAHLPHGASRTALARFFAADPHALAQAVLWTHRSREMTRRLLQAEAVPGTPAAPSTVLSDEQHRALLERRCVGCHATPAPLADSPGAAVAAGVECESCHGPASGWLHTHYRHGFDRATPGFLDTKDLILRAAACVACHVGPQAAAGGPQAVDHDLIAAGHPRLTFELSAYAHSLPAHWDRAADAARHGGAFHFLTHQAGQRAIADRRAAADQQADNPAAAVADFAQIDCDACHHSLAAGSWRLRPVGEATAAAHLRPIGEPLLFPRETSPPPPTAERLAWLARTFESLASGPRAGWAAYVEALLAARAVLADLEAAPSAGASSAATVNSAAAPAAGDALAAARQALDALARYLDREAFAETAAAAPPRVYDTPARYDPQQAAQRAAEAAARLDALSRQLHSAPAP